MDLCLGIAHAVGHELREVGAGGFQRSLARGGELLLDALGRVGMGLQRGLDGRLRQAAAARTDSLDHRALSLASGCDQDWTRRRARSAMATNCSCAATLAS